MRSGYEAVFKMMGNRSSFVCGKRNEIGSEIKTNTPLLVAGEELLLLHQVVRDLEVADLVAPALLGVGLGRWLHE